MSNTYNLFLSDFLTPNIQAVYDQDYYVDGKTLKFQLSSDFFRRITSVKSENKGLCALDLFNLPNLTAISIREPNLVQFSSSTNLAYISAEDIGVSNLVLSGGSFDLFAIFFSPNLKSINLEKVNSLGDSVLLFYNYQLSSITWGNSLKYVPSYMVLNNNYLNNETINTLYSSICSVSGNSNLASISIFLTNPFSGTETGYIALTSLQNAGANINVTVVPPTPSITPTPTITPTITPEPTPSTTVTPTLTLTPEPTPSNTPVVTITPTVTPTPSITRTPTPTPTITPTQAPFLDMTIWVANETTSTNDDSAVQIRPDSPPFKTFTISSDLGSSSVATNSTATFNNSRSNVWPSGTAKTFTIAATDSSVAATIVITPGYNTANTTVSVTLTGGAPTLSSYAGVTTFTKPVTFVNGAFV